MQIMFILVGEQTIPNLLPILQLQTAKDMAVVLVTTRTAPIESAIDSLRYFLLNRLSHLINEEYIIRAEGDKFDLEANLMACRQALMHLKLLSKTQDEQLELIFNMTSGTKIMSLAFYQMALETGGKLIYLDSDQNRILSVLPAAPPLSLTVSLTVQDYLLAHGYQIRATELPLLQNTSASSQAAAILANSPASALTELAGQLRKSTNKISLSGLKAETINLFEQLNGLLYKVEHHEKDEYVLQPLQNQNFFPGGKWLEQHAFDCAASLFPQVKDVQPGLTIFPHSSPHLENELDLAFTSGHHLWIGFCKAAARPDGKWVDELTARAHPLGSFCRKIIITSCDTSTSASFCARAVQEKVRILDIRALPNLSQHFIALLNS